MTTKDKDRQNLIESIATLGGPVRAAERSGVPRSTLIHWMRKGFPYYRQHEVEKLIDLARKAELEMLEKLQRKHRAADPEKLETARHLVLTEDERKQRGKAAK